MKFEVWGLKFGVWGLGFQVSGLVRCRAWFSKRPEKKTWPTINVVVFAKAGKDSSGANKVRYDQVGSIWKGFNSEGSIIDDITQYMTNDGKDLMNKYRAEYANE